MGCRLHIGGEHRPHPDDEQDSRGETTHRNLLNSGNRAPIKWRMGKSPGPRSPLFDSLSAGPHPHPSVGD